MSCENGEHKNVVEDVFSKEIKSVVRYVPGDCYCRDCHSAIPAWWNRGKPKAIEGGADDNLES